MVNGYCFGKEKKKIKIFSLAFYLNVYEISSVKLSDWWSLIKVKQQLSGFFKYSFTKIGTSDSFVFLYIIPYRFADILGRSGFQDEGLQVTILNNLRVLKPAQG